MSQRDLRRHRQTVHKEIVLHDIASKIAQAEEKGMEAEVGEDGALYFHCYMCDYMSTRMDTVKAHIDRKHMKLRPYQPTKPHHVREYCALCDYSTLKRSSMVKHKLKVHGKDQITLCVS